jgi:uncharacterized protein
MAAAAATIEARMRRPAPGGGDCAPPAADGARVAEVAGEPLRRCIATREAKPRRTLLRFAIGPDGVLVPDLAARLPGRGLWLTPQREVLALAMRKNLFAKAAETGVTVAADLPDRVEMLLARRCLEILGLARRAGEAVAGFEKVREWLAAGRAAVLLAARDGAEDGRRKLRALGSDLRLIELFEAAELAQALGREHVIHAAIAPGRLAERVAGEADRLAGFRQPA